MEKIDDTGTCWLWTAACFTNGYGAFRDGTKQRKAHRWSYEHFHGPIPAGMIVMHSCDIHACVNPAHLSIGTARENQQDMTTKGRGRIGDRNGSRHSRECFLTMEIAEAIRESYATGNLTQKAIGDLYGIHQSYVSAIVRKVRWRP